MRISAISGTTSQAIFSTLSSIILFISASFGSEGISLAGASGGCSASISMDGSGSSSGIRTGIGGSGKSTLAKEVAKRNAWRYPNGLVWVDFIDETAIMPSKLRNAIALQLGVDEKKEGLSVFEGPYDNQPGEKGVVRSPGFYELKKDMRVIDLILASGGLLRDAYTELAELYQKKYARYTKILDLMQDQWADLVWQA